MFFNLIAMSLSVFGQCTSLETFEVRGNSMAPKLFDKQNIKIEKDFYKCHKLSPKVGDIVTFKFNDLIYIKRIHGVGGDMLTFKENSLFINGRNMNIEVSAKEQKLLSLYAKIPMSSFLVFGDNLVDSKDSRHFGVIPLGSILGRFIN